MKLVWGWMWCILLLSSLALEAVAAQSEEDVSDEEEVMLDEDEQEAMVEEEDDYKDPSENEEVAGDANVSFQVIYETPVPTGEVYFAETFDDGSLDRWQLSKTVKEDADDDIAKYDGKWAVEQLKENKVPGDLGMVLKSRAKHHAIAAPLQKPFVFQDDPLVIQYEVNFQDGIDCGGAYIKLLSDTGSLDLERFHDRTPYTIMFGPDKCGEDYKLHFIFCHQNPLNKVIEEKHAKRVDVDLKKFYTDKKTHLYTLVLNPDNSYDILIDQSNVSHGSLLHDMVPPVNPPKEIDDPSDSKPLDWDEKAKIPDPEAVKPDDWDEEAPAKIEDPGAVKPEGWLEEELEFVPDPRAEKPEDWDAEMDGEWEAPQIPNPACETAPGCGEWKPPMINNPEYKGKWKAPLIENPNYQGIWKPRKIDNPDYFEDLQPFRMTPFKAVGLELWSMTSDIYFDNFIITSHKEVSDRWASDSWGLKKLVASANEPGFFSQLVSAAEERPWLWVVYVLTVGLPVGLGVLFCWPKKSDDDYVYKRVDLPQADVGEEEDDEEEVDVVRVEEEEEEVDVVRVEEEEEKADEASATESAPAAEGTKKDDEDDDDDGAEEESKAHERTSEDEPKGEGDAVEEGKQAVRKRRVRKD